MTSQALASAVTGWLRQRFTNCISLLRRLAPKADRELVWHIYDERSNDMPAVEEVWRRFGFCDEHIEMLHRMT